MAKANCPKCSWEKEVSDSLIGKKAQCPKCQEKFYIEEPIVENKINQSPKKLALKSRLPKSKMPQKRMLSSQGYSPPQSSSGLYAIIALLLLIIVGGGGYIYYSKSMVTRDFLVDKSGREDSNINNRKNASNDEQNPETPYFKPNGDNSNEIIAENPPNEEITKTPEPPSEKPSPPSQFEIALDSLKETIKTKCPACNGKKAYYLLIGKYPTAEGVKEMGGDIPCTFCARTGKPDLPVLTFSSIDLFKKYKGNFRSTQYLNNCLLIYGELKETGIYKSGPSKRPWVLLNGGGSKFGVICKLSFQHIDILDKLRIGESLVIFTRSGCVKYGEDMIVGMARVVYPKLKR